MPPALKPTAAPSRRLLRFLRAQSEGLSFAKCASRLETRRHACTCVKARPVDRAHSVPITRREPTLQAALFGLDAILPKSLARQRATLNTTKNKSPTAARTATRYASSHRTPPDQTPPDDGAKSSWQELLFGREQKKECDSEPLKDGSDIRVRLEEESGSIFQRRALTSKAPLDPRLRCTEVDGAGKVIMVDGELKKSELIAKVRLRLPVRTRKSNQTRSY
jgi:magnesium transporter